MQQVFIELVNYRDAWRAKPKDERQAYVQAIIKAIDEQQGNGLEVIAWGFNDRDTDHRAPYDFYCVYRTPSIEYQRGFEQIVAESGWHDLFEQIHVRGAPVSAEQLLLAFAELETPA